MSPKLGQYVLLLASVVVKNRLRGEISVEFEVSVGYQGRGILIDSL